MAFFQPRIGMAKVSFSPFSSDSMMGIGNVVLDHIVTRIKAVQDVTDSRARPLKESYADEKRKGRYVALGGPVKYRGLPYRDWTLRGRTLGACKVKYASQDRVTIGPTSQETGKIMTILNRKDHMWGISPSDGQVLVAATLATLRRVASVKVERTGTQTKVA